MVVRGAGDLATGCILRLVRSGFRVAALETAQPTAIRRTVSLCEAMYEGRAEVEGVRAVRVASLDELKAVLDHAGPPRELHPVFTVATKRFESGR